MKGEAEVRKFFDAWCEQAEFEPPEPDTWEAGVAAGYLLALSCVLADKEAGRRARVAIRNLRGEL